MTGFGKAICTIPDKTVNIEIRSLNSKQLDIISKLPSIFKDKEPEIRSRFSRELERGKVDVTFTVEYNTESQKFSINRSLAKQYYNDLLALSDELEHNDNTDMLALVMRMPEILNPEKEELKENEWAIILSGLDEALKHVNTFREEEGRMLEKDFIERVELIQKLLSRINKYEKSRLEEIKVRIEKAIRLFFDDTQFDKNRFEQEMIYYIEKLDITEEKVRLKKHCEYFLETLNENSSSGKKLGFISQEMGREINTIGSKANDANIQKIVVMMKDELEKIKEQLSNIL